MTLALLVLVTTALAASLIGVFVFLRNLAMVGDAISHTVLLGIVLAFFMTGDLNSPWMMISAALFGLITVVCIELLMKSGLIREDSAIGLVFPFFFALAVILISTRARNVHLDTDIVLMGEVIFAPFDTVTFLGLTVPRAFRRMFLILLLNSAFILTFYKELKQSAFDVSAAILSGFSITFLHYGLMALVSITTVAAFDAVGAILLISFLITPPATAYLFCKQLGPMIGLSLLFAAVNATLAYYISLGLNVSMAGTAACMNTLVFFLAFLASRNGLIIQVLRRHRQKEQFDTELLILHLSNHVSEDNAGEELGWHSLSTHLNWPQRHVDHYIGLLLKDGMITSDDRAQIYRLTEKGKQEAERLSKQYHLKIRDHHEYGI